MRKLWSSIRRGESPPAGEAPPQPAPRADHVVEKIAEVELRLAALRQGEETRSAGPPPLPLHHERTVILKREPAPGRTPPPIPLVPATAASVVVAPAGPALAAVPGPQQAPLDLLRDPRAPRMVELETLPDSSVRLELATGEGRALLVPPRQAAPSVSQAPLVQRARPAAQQQTAIVKKPAQNPSQPPVRVRRMRIGEVLLERGLITPQQLDTALAAQRQSGGERLGSILVSSGAISMYQMVSALGQSLGVAVIDQQDVKEITIDQSARDALPVDMIRRLEVVPLWANDKTLRIAMADPTNLEVVDELRFKSGRWIEVVLAPEAVVRALIASIFATDSVMSEAVQSPLDPTASIEQVALETEAEHEHEVYELIQESADRPVVNFVNFLLADSVRLRASDIHIEPYESSLRVRFRVDGELMTIVSPPKRLHIPVVSRIKVMGGMDISKRRVPQDGHLAVRHNGTMLHFRVSTLPTVYGEKCVLRLMTKDASLADLDLIGIPAEELVRLRRAIAAPQGLVLVTGPTGSGKTTTVHASLNAISDPTINVATLEDPVEITLPGINHVQVMEGVGVSFPDGLRSLLRQDPDVIFVGEMRDKEVSAIAIKASLTGHLVLSTLHTNSALEAFDRLDDIGVERYLVAATIQTVVAQRLLRKICANCAESVPLSYYADKVDAAILNDLAGCEVRMGKGCDKCNKTGGRGRAGAYEVLPIDKETRELIRKKAPLEVMLEVVKGKGFRTMYDNGLDLVRQGLVTPVEINRVLYQPD